MKYLPLIITFLLVHIAAAQNNIISENIGNKIIKLEHEIEFYWQQEPFNSDKKFDTSVLKNPKTLTLPRANWGKQINIKPKGYGTFQYRLLLPDTIHNYSLYTPRFSGGAKIWANDKFQFEHGIYSKDLEQSTSNGKPLVIVLPKEKNITITFLTSNNDNILGGGIDYFLALGKKEFIDNYTKKELIKDYIVFLVLLLLTFYQAYLYFLYKDKRYLYLMLACLIGSLRSICIQQHIIYDIFSDSVPFYIVQKLRLITVYAGSITMLLYFRELLPKQVHKKWFKFLIGIQVLGIISYFPVGTFLATRLTIIMRIIFLIVLVYYVYLFVRAFIKKEKYAKEIALTTLFIFAIAINSIFKSAIVINTNYIGITALFLFLLAHMLLNAKIQRDKLKLVENLSNKLNTKQEENKNLKLETLRRIREKQKIKTSLKDIPHKTSEISSILADMQKNNGEDEKSKVLKTQIIADYQEFTTKLLELHPNLTKIDLEIATFIILGKSRVEIADLRGVTVNSVKTSRSRLRKKLELPQDVLLDDYLKSLTYRN